MDQSYERARKKVKRKKKFYSELATFVAVASGLMLLNISTNPNNYWFLWATVPWGLTLLMRGIKLIIDEKTSDWEQREIEKELSRGSGSRSNFEDDYLELEDYDPKDKQIITRGGYRDSDLV